VAEFKESESEIGCNGFLDLLLVEEITIAQGSVLPWQSNIVTLRSRARAICQCNKVGGY
jgi:hypothetical protein